MPAPHYPGFDTLSLHAGSQPDPIYGACTPPIYLNAAFAFNNTDHATALFNMEQAGYLHSSMSNPTNAVLEERIAALEAGTTGLATASGQAALHLGIATIASAGSHIVAARNICPGSQQLLGYTLQRFGIETTFVDPRNMDAWRNAIRPQTKMLFGTTLDHAGSHVLDIPRIASIAHENHLPLMVDASLSTPYLLRPFEHGADLIFHCATQFLAGHGSAIGGLLVDGGTFNWQHAYEKTGHFSELCQPDPRGIVFSEISTVAPFALRARHEGLPHFGAALSPQNAFFILQGIETLGLRMEKHLSNTRKIVAFLNTHAAVESVNYPELPTHADHRLSQSLMPQGSGAVFSFNLKGDVRRMIEALQLFSHAAHVGDAKSLILHPASTTHLHVPREQLALFGLTETSVQLSVGLENAEDLIEDLQLGLKMAQRKS